MKEIIDRITTARAGRYEIDRGLGAATANLRHLPHSSGRRWPMGRGTFGTQLEDRESHAAALITDAHMGTFVDGSAPNQVTDGDSANVRTDRPDFVLALGDNVAWNTSGNQAQESPLGVERAYTMYRRRVGPLTSSSPHFGLIGSGGTRGSSPTTSKSLYKLSRQLTLLYKVL